MMINASFLIVSALSISGPVVWANTDYHEFEKVDNQHDVSRDILGNIEKRYSEVLAEENLLIRSHKAVLFIEYVEEVLPYLSQTDRYLATTYAIEVKMRNNETFDQIKVMDQIVQVVNEHDEEFDIITEYRSRIQQGAKYDHANDPGSRIYASALLSYLTLADLGVRQSFRVASKEKFVFFSKLIILESPEDVSLEYIIRMVGRDIRSFEEYKKLHEFSIDFISAETELLSANDIQEALNRLLFELSLVVSTENETQKDAIKHHVGDILSISNGLIPRYPLTIPSYLEYKEFVPESYIPDSSF